MLSAGDKSRVANHLLSWHISKTNKMDPRISAALSRVLFGCRALAGCSSDGAARRPCAPMAPSGKSTKAPTCDRLLPFGGDAFCFLFLGNWCLFCFEGKPKGTASLGAHHLETTECWLPCQFVLCRIPRGWHRHTPMKRTRKNPGNSGVQNEQTTGPNGGFQFPVSPTRLGLREPLEKPLL